MSDPELHFVLGTGRCGSTLLHEVLCQHDDVAFLSNLEDHSRLASWLGPYNGRLYRRLPPWVTEKGRARFAPSEGYLALGREVSPVFEYSIRDLVATDASPWLARRLERFFVQRAGRAQAPVYLHKFTGWPRASLLNAVFPQARFVHVLRDGRAVANSWLQMPWWLGYRGPSHWHWGPLSPEHEDVWERSGRSFSVLAGLAWLQLVAAFEEAEADVGEKWWLQLRYEDLVRAPAEHLEEILEFVGLPRTAGFEARLARYDFRVGRADAFRRDLDARDVALLDDILGPTLERYGYV